MKLINFFNPKINKYLPRNSFLKSRFTYILFFILSFCKLKSFLKQNKNEILIVHLLTVLPIIIVTIFNLKINLILRISGKVKNNILRNKLNSTCIFFFILHPDVLYFSNVILGNGIQNEFNIKFSNNSNKTV